MSTVFLFGMTRLDDFIATLDDEVKVRCVDLIERAKSWDDHFSSLYAQAETLKRSGWQLSKAGHFFEKEALRYVDVLQHNATRLLSCYDTILDSGYTLCLMYAENDSVY